MDTINLQQPDLYFKHELSLLQFHQRVLVHAPVIRHLFKHILHRGLDIESMLLLGQVTIHQAGNRNLTDVLVVNFSCQVIDQPFSHRREARVIPPDDQS